MILSPHVGAGPTAADGAGLTTGAGAGADGAGLTMGVDGADGVAVTAGADGAGVTMGADGAAVTAGADGAGVTMGADGAAVTHGAPAAAGRVSARLQPHQPINRARLLVAAIWRPPRQRENLIFACFRPLPHPAVRSPPRPYAPTPWPLDCALRYQHLTILFWPDRRRNPRLGLPHIWHFRAPVPAFRRRACSISCFLVPFGTLNPWTLLWHSFYSTALQRHFFCCAIWLHPLRLLAPRAWLPCAIAPHLCHRTRASFGPRSLASAPRLVSPSSASFSRRTSFCPSACARVSPPRLASLQRTHPVISAPPRPPSAHAPACRRFARTLRPPFVSTPRFAPVPCTHHTSPPRALRFRTRALGQCTPPRRLCVPHGSLHPRASHSAPRPHPTSSLPASPSRPGPTLAPRTASRPTLTPPHTVSRPPSRPRPTLAHRFALVPRLASLSHPCAHAPRTPHLASRPRTAPRLAPMPRFAPAPRFTPARAPRCAPATPLHPRPLPRAHAPRFASPPRLTCARFAPALRPCPPHLTTPAHSPAPAPLIPTLRFLRSRSGSGSRTTTTLRTHLPSRASALRPNREQRLWDQ
ncbi:hypothetical protein B0H14DRAFT_3426886 [Mycena olivaceomarginata]|nr:hypothetical protein B0H14DRAFT_3426886 [Mycena olivaceomarginata]